MVPRWFGTPPGMSASHCRPPRLPPPPGHIPCQRVSRWGPAVIPAPLPAALRLLLWGGAGQGRRDALRCTPRLLCHLSPHRSHRPQEGPFPGPSLPAVGAGKWHPGHRRAPARMHGAAGSTGRPCRRRAGLCLRAPAGGRPAGSLLGRPTRCRASPANPPPPLPTPWPGSPPGPAWLPGACWGLRSRSGRWARSRTALRDPS